MSLVAVHSHLVELAATEINPSANRPGMGWKATSIDSRALAAVLLAGSALGTLAAPPARAAAVPGAAETGAAEPKAPELVPPEPGETTAADPQTGDAPPPDAVPAEAPGDRQSYPATDFFRFAPHNALDMLRNVPGFQIRTDDSGNRGLGQASDNVIVNGQRLSSKSDSLFDQLRRIPTDAVVRIDIVDGASLSIPGLSGQVADVITRPDTFSGQFEWNPEFRPHFSHPGYTNGSVSVKGAATDTLQYTLALGNDSGRGGFGGPYRILDGSGAVIERRDGRLWSDFDAPKASASLKWDAPGSAEGNVNALYRRRYSTYNENEDRMPIAGAATNRDLYGRRRGYNYEIGGDFAFPLVGARLKLIGLDRFDHNTYIDQLVDRAADGGTLSGGQYAPTVDSGEVIGRAELGWKWGKADWQIALESAFNRLDKQASLFDLDPLTADYVEIPFPGGDGGVREERYEGTASYGRPLTPPADLAGNSGGGTIDHHANRRQWPLAQLLPAQGQRQSGLDPHEGPRPVTEGRTRGGAARLRRFPCQHRSQPG